MASKRVSKRKPPIGGGERFQRLEAELRSRGHHHPAALAAWIGRQKYGKERFQELSESGKRNRKTTAPTRKEHRVRV